MTKDRFSRLDRAARAAYQNTSRRLGMEDPALARYHKLTDVDFDTIARTQGPEELVRYVETMESRAMKGARNGPRT